MAKRRANNEPLCADQEALLSAIRDNPDEDTPRLMYADLLDEIGGASHRARAEFIRLQIGAAQHPRGDREGLALSDRAGSLLRANGAAWVAELGVRVMGANFNRGFAEAVRLSAADFIRRGERLFRAAPIQAVDIEDYGDRADELAACPALGRVVTLGLTDCRADCVDIGIGPVCHSPHLGGLKRLSLGREATWSTEGLIGSPLLSHLTALELACGLVDADEVEALVSDPAFAGVTSFNLRTTDIGDAGARVLAAAPALGGLRELGLPRNGLTNAGALALARSTTLRSLRYLNVSENEIGTAGLRALHRRSGLTELEVDWNPPAGEAIIRRIEATRPVASVPGWDEHLCFLAETWKKS